MPDNNYLDWSKWLSEGYFISYLRDGVRYYEHIIMRDFAHFEYIWPESITSETESGPYVLDDLEITKGYDSASNTNQFWQLLFGIKGQAYIYIELPTDLHRHGVPKRPKPNSSLREVSHFTEPMSPFNEPSFITEHFLMRPDLSRVDIQAWNPEATTLTDVRLNFMIAKFVTERIGTEVNGTATPSFARWKDTLDKLCSRMIPHRPITLMPVRAPAEAPAGE